MSSSQTKQYMYGAAYNDPSSIEFPPENEIPLIEKISNPGYLAPVDPVKSTNDASTENILGKVPTLVPDDVRELYNTSISNMEQPIEEPAPEQQQHVEEVSEEVGEIAYDEPESVREVYNAKKNQQSMADNFKALRLAKEEAERNAERYAKESREREQLLSQLLAMQTQQKPQLVQQEPDFNSIINSIPDDSLVDSAQFKRAYQENRKQTEQIAQRFAQYERQVEDLRQENTIRAKYPDLDKVMSEENKTILSKREPIIYNSFKSMPDSWEKVEAVYRMIKSYGIDKTFIAQKEKMLATANMNKPRPGLSVSPQKGATPLSTINSFVDEFTMSESEKEQERKEMYANIGRMQ